MRRAGILTAISSLPSNYGIGDLGKEAYEFIDILVESGFKVWQILPINPVGYGNSPYQPYSSYAGDDIYISLDLLVKEGLLKSEELEVFNENSNKVEYDKVRDFKNKYFKLAYERSKNDKTLEENINEFKSKNEWVYKYAVFITFKKLNNLKSWLEWPKEQKLFVGNKNYDISKYDEEINYEIFVQYMFYKQWFNLKEYANSKNIKIMGDIPIYVGIDSADVWWNKESFLLDEDYNPSFIAGVPPDYFSETGQRWGNPIYDWDYLKTNNFSFWIERLKWSNSIFDIIRIDHFRAFDTYWKIPASCPTAVEGEWIEAPGYALFDEIYRKIPNIKIIAEDLGDLRPEVLDLRDNYNLSGMLIMQFELESDNKIYLNSKKTIVYTGTHDNQTTLGWYKGLNERQRKNARNKLMRYKDRLYTDKVIHLCLDCISDLVIIPIQDFIRLDDSARINTPGTVGSPNWEWKLIDFTNVRKNLMRYKNLLKKTKRF